MGSNTNLNTSGGDVSNQTALTAQKQSHEWSKAQKQATEYLELEFTRKLARYLPEQWSDLKTNPKFLEKVERLVEGMIKAVGNEDAIPKARLQEKVRKRLEYMQRKNGIEFLKRAKKQKVVAGANDNDASTSTASEPATGVVVATTNEASSSSDDE